MYTDGPQSKIWSALNCMNDSWLYSLTTYKLFFFVMVVWSFPFVGMFSIFRFCTLLMLMPMRQVLNAVFFHFSGGVSGISGISNSRVVSGVLLSIIMENNSIVPMAIGVLKTLLKKILPSKSFQCFIFYP